MPRLRRWGREVSALCAECRDVRNGTLQTATGMVALPIPIVAADVSPLIIPVREKFEPTHVGCYGIPNSAFATDSFPEFSLGWRVVQATGLCCPVTCRTKKKTEKLAGRLPTATGRLSVPPRQKLATDSFPEFSLGGRVVQATGLCCPATCRTKKKTEKLAGRLPTATGRLSVPPRQKLATDSFPEFSLGWRVAQATGL